MKRSLSASLAALLLNTILISAQPKTIRGEKDFASDIGAFAQETMVQLPDLPGFAVVVVIDDKPVFIRGFGMADMEAKVRADVDTMYYIASSTKSFTALAAALLDSEGKIRLDEPVMKYASGISLRSPVPEKVTIRDLLTHTSGLRNPPLGFRMAYSGDSDPKDMTRVFAEGTTFNEAMHGRYAYTNLGYNIYAVLLQNHMNKRWQDLLQERIFDPLRMKHTTAYISRAGTKGWKVAAPYILDPRTGKTMQSPLSKTDNNMQSAGGMFSSASDIGRWLSMNMNGGRLDGKQVIPAEIVSAVHKGYTATTREAPPFSGAGEYGLGWQIGKYKDQKVVYHHGGFPGYRSHISFLPDRKIGVAVLVNDNAAGGNVADLLATYAYDRWLQGSEIEAEYAKRLQDLSENYAQGKQRLMSGSAERAKRSSQLTKPVANYVGRYESDLFGIMEIMQKGSDLFVRLGNMNSTATPFTEKETIRVELIPGSGEVIKFTMNANDEVESLTYAGAVFRKKAK